MDQENVQVQELEQEIVKKMKKNNPAMNSLDAKCPLEWQYLLNDGFFRRTIPTLP